MKELNAVKANYDDVAKTANPTIRQPVSSEIVQFAQELVSKAQAISERVDEKLAPVMNCARTGTGEELGKDVAEYPPLFADLRKSLNGINAALDRIAYALTRTEL